MLPASSAGESLERLNASAILESDRIAASRITSPSCGRDGDDARGDDGGVHASPIPNPNPSRRGGGDSSPNPSPSRCGGADDAIPNPNGGDAGGNF